MTKRFFAPCLLALLAVLAAAPAWAELAERPAPTGGILSLLPKPQTSEHRIAIGGRELRYQATAGTLSLLGGDGAVTAEVFYTAYAVQGEGTPQEPRPITFVFNGGPGAASAYLHLGALGPRIVQTGPEGGFRLPAQPLVDNPDTWLDFTDLVFVDPVGTGYSREAPGQSTKAFWGVEQDAASLGSFIRLFLAQTGRMTAPVYLAGESYGGFRAALLARRLQADVGIAPRGIVLISPALEFSLVRPDQFDLLHWALELPSLAAVRLQAEGVTGPALAARLAEVERYAMGDYLTALAAGLEEGGRRASPKVAELTGLPLDLVRRNFARIPTQLFAEEFASARRSELSPYDGTIAAPEIAAGSPDLGTPDPVLDRSEAALTASTVAYLRDELGFRTDISYRLLNEEVSRSWDYGFGGSRQGYAGVMGDLQQARALDPSLGVLIVHGFTDLVTPYMASRYLAGQLSDLPGARPVEVETLEGGHMMYLLPASRLALTELARRQFEPIAP